MESWRHIFRRGITPLLTTKQLEALRTALLNDDPALIQGATTEPPPLMAVAEWPVEAGCALSYCGWKADGLNTVAEVEQFFVNLTKQIDTRMGEFSAIGWFLTWFDETPRDEMRAALLPEVNAALAQRHSCEEQPQPRCGGESEVPQPTLSL